MRYLLKQTAIISLLTITACKTRHVEINRDTITDRSVTSSMIRHDSAITDTTKTSIRLQTKQTGKDSFEVDIIPDTGLVQIVHGSYIGKARSIQIKGTVLQNLALDETIQQNKGEIISSSVQDSTVIKNDIQKRSYEKVIFSKSNVLITLTCLLLLGITLLVKKRFF